MGSGASIDHGSGLVVGTEGSLIPSSRFFCHECSRVFALGNGGTSHTYNCPRCQSSFLEEVERSSATNNNFRSRSSALNDEQSRRLANAGIMLRLLEIQLRDELDSLQNAFTNNIARRQEDKIKPMTVVVLQKLCKRSLCLDMLCSQPSCPVCSEDYHIGGIITLLPCSHFFHEGCVMPWLEAKRNCPICRYVLTDSVPSVEDLEKFTEIELREKLFMMAVPLAPRDLKSTRPRTDLAVILHKALLDKKIILDSVEAASVGYERRQLEGRLVGVSDGGVGVGVGGEEGGFPGNRVRDIAPYQHTHLLFGSGTAAAGAASSTSEETDQARWTAIRREIEAETEAERERERARALRPREPVRNNSTGGISPALLAALAGQPVILNPGHTADISYNNWTSDGVIEGPGSSQSEVPVQSSTQVQNSTHAEPSWGRGSARGSGSGPSFEEQIMSVQAQSRRRDRVGGRDSMSDID